jgi:hypothetical protein
MRAALLILAVVGLFLFLHHRWEAPVLLVDAASPDCPAPLANPCDDVDCDRPNTQESA